MENRPEQQRLPSFADLEAQSEVDPDILVRVMEDYVSTGAAISATTLVNIIKRTPLDIPHLAMVGEAATVGIEDQLRRGFPNDAAQYVLVATFVTVMLSTRKHTPDFNP